MKRLFPFLGAILILTGILNGCAGKSTDLKFTLAKERVLEKFAKSIRTAKIYRDLDTILIADVLWDSPQLKKSYVAELRKNERISEEEERNRYIEIEEKAANEIEFLAGIYTGEEKWNDFEKTDSIWKVRLKSGDDSHITPARIEKLKLEEIPDAYLFPHLTNWKTIYRFIFAKDVSMESMEQYELEISSLVGKASFLWKKNMNEEDAATSTGK